MLSRPLPSDSWVQALADSGPWMPPPEWAQDYPWINQLPQPLDRAPTGFELTPPDEGRMRTVMPTAVQEPGPNWSDIPDWMQALADDRDWAQGRVLQGPYDGWGGGAMQARRRGLR